ncbi:EutN/CcmL family microcompartment protein [Peribacillus acanthi]|uniref:EutN/CcmL family microcompartment protein n=1 Tax=Peribacillus acanthi TaxID=2171554 RepID=UPI000D3E9AD1|nr:EutN/CcmL family microcompartment protein [Peribacillus acanthi]
MIVGRVVGKIVSTRKYTKLNGYKFLLIQPLNDNSQKTFVAADELGAGEGEIVLVANGSMVKHGLTKDAPIDSLVVGIVDNEINL